MNNIHRTQGMRLKTLVLILVFLLIGSIASCVVKAEEPNGYFGKYKDVSAHARTTGETVFVIVSADWCGPCKVLKKHIKDLKTSGQLGATRFAVVDIDKERSIAKALMGSHGSVPQLLSLKWDSEKGEWRASKIIGCPSKEYLTKWLKKEIDK